MCRREVKAGVNACPSCGAILENAKAWQIYHPEPAPSSSHARTIALSGVLVIILCVAYQGWEQPPKQAPENFPAASPPVVAPPAERSASPGSPDDPIQQEALPPDRLESDAPPPNKTEMLSQQGKDIVAESKLASVSQDVRRPPKAPIEPTAASSKFFPDITRQVPVILTNDTTGSMKQMGFYLAKKGDIVLVDIEVHHVPEAVGPKIIADQHFKATSVEAFETAVYAAAHAVRYDVRHLRAHLELKTTILQSGVAIDGPSAGLGWAIAVASAILGDSIRPDVCFSGTINLNFEVGPVGGLEDKINGCRQMKYQELIVPAGQWTMDLALKGMGYDMKITEVRALADAYQVATGQPLRRAP